MRKCGTARQALAVWQAHVNGERRYRYVGGGVYRAAYRVGNTVYKVPRRTDAWQVQVEEFEKAYALRTTPRGDVTAPPMRLFWIVADWSGQPTFVPVIAVPFVEGERYDGLTLSGIADLHGGNVRRMPDGTVVVIDLGDFGFNAPDGVGFWACQVEEV